MPGPGERQATAGGARRGRGEAEGARGASHSCCSCRPAATPGREGGRGGRRDGGHSRLLVLRSHQLPKVLLPTFTFLEAGSGSVTRLDSTALSRASDVHNPFLICSQLCYLYSSLEHGLRPPLARAAAAFGSCAGFRLPPPGRDGSVFEECGPKLQFHHSLTQYWEICER